jgi:predicted porin
LFATMKIAVRHPLSKLTILVTSVIALAGPSGAHAAANFYGRLNVAINYLDQEQGFVGYALSNNRAGRPWRGNPFITTPRGPANRLGLKGSGDLGPEYRVVYQLEFGFSLSDSNDNAFNLDRSETLRMRNTFVGLAGPWGSLLAGRLDTPFKSSTAPLDLFTNTLGDSASTTGFQNYRMDNSLFYASPNLAGFQFSAALVAGGGATLDGVSNIDSDSLAEAYSLALIYTRGPLYASLAWERQGADLADPSDPEIQKDWDKLRLGLGLLDWRSMTLTLIFEHWDHAFWGSDHSADLWQLQAGYAFGNILLKATVGGNQQSGNYKILTSFCCDLYAENDFGFKTWALGGDYNFTKHTKAYLVYSDNQADALIDPVTGGSSDALDWRGVQIGLSHAF